jgi:2-polyprenyl-3-methyl-5-hydroxy-6-metoxy-1,4-benzoquinol methylase
MKLTDVDFWDSYWSKYQLPSEVDYSFSFERCLAMALKKHLRGVVGGDVMEIGCAPGKWLAFMTREFGLVANGIEYSRSGMSATIENFRLLQLDVSSIKTGDFFQIAPVSKYDVVMSLGFIEHFENVDNVVNLHLKWLKPGGILIIGVPNFTGVNRLIQSILDKTIIDKHNLKIMNLNYFNKVAKKFNLNTVFLNYIGSFEPSLFISKSKYGNLTHFLMKVFLYPFRFLRKLSFFDGINSRLFSSYILAIYKKSENH